MDTKLKPIIKWLGGKTQIVDRIINKIEPYSEQLEDSRFIEPFVGGGAVFLALMPKKLLINDINPYLMNMYRIIKENPEELIIDLKTHQLSKEYYYTIRKEQIFDENKVREASKFIFLNKAGFRGIYRENSKGEFNVPFGNYKNPLICDEKNIRNILIYFNSIDIIILNLSFEYVLTTEYITERDFMYLDPPYMHMKENQFTKYNKTDFGVKNQEKLCNILNNNQIQCKFLESNSPTINIINMYSKFKQDIFTAKRSISVKQGKTILENNEILISNF
jgi:DNA adenine methylase